MSIGVEETNERLACTVGGRGRWEEGRNRRKGGVARKLVPWKEGVMTKLACGGRWRHGSEGSGVHGRRSKPVAPRVTGRCRKVSGRPGWTLNNGRWPLTVDRLSPTRMEARRRGEVKR